MKDFITIRTARHGTGAKPADNQLIASAPRQNSRWYSCRSKTPLADRIRKISIIAAIVFCVSLFLAGCQSNITAGMSLENGVLVVENKIFASNINVVAFRRTVVDSAYLKAQVTLRNAAKHDFSCQYRFYWKDKDGLDINSAETLWTPLILHGCEEVPLQSICPVPGAEDFRIVLRPNASR